MEGDNLMPISHCAKAVLVISRQHTARRSFFIIRLNKLNRIVRLSIGLVSNFVVNVMSSCENI
jgi:hypothetical protein